MKKLHGFTLIEVLIATVLVAIITALAWPSYLEHTRKGRRGSAQTLMMDIANRQAQYFLDARNYAVGADSITDLNVTVPSGVSDFYDVTIEPSAPATPPTYRIVATPKTGGSQEADGVLTLSSDGARTRNGADGW